MLKIYNLMYSLIFFFTIVNVPNAKTATINASSCSQFDVQSAINSASAGDVVTIPTGKSTWTTSISIPNNKKITLQGAGMYSTIITRSPVGLAISLNSSGSRVTAIGLVDGQISSNGYNARIDHCHITFATYNSAAIDFTPKNLSDAIISTGLIDNNILHNVRVLVSGTNWMLSEGDIQHQLWANELNIGSSEAVYIEDNVFTKDDDSRGNCIDGNYGGRYVFRFNTVTNLDIEVHSMQGNNRALRKWEIYENTITQTSGYWQMLIRGGTGICFNNSATGSVNLRLDNVRSFKDVPTFGLCDGNKPWDSNDDATGWHARDQIGMGGDESLWSSGNYPTQTKTPAYFWGNTDDGSNWEAQVVNNSNDHIKPNRDYYEEVTGFDGTEGVGIGTLANRPKTCTVGVGYWATDQGEWNSEHAGPDGQFYKCTSTNTWELYYIPYTYPYPLTLSPPDNLILIK